MNQVQKSPEKGQDTDPPARPPVRTVHASVRLNAEDLARIDAQIPILSPRWRRATRSDVLRELILDGLAARELKEGAE